MVEALDDGELVFVYCELRHFSVLLQRLFLVGAVLCVRGPERTMPPRSLFSSRFQKRNLPLPLPLLVSPHQLSYSQGNLASFTKTHHETAPPTTPTRSIKNAGDTVYLVTPFVDGGELFDWVKDNGASTEDVVKPLFRQLVDGLQVR